MTQTPTTTFQLIENLKAVVDARLILDTAFYNEENIRRLTGGEDCVIRHEATTYEAEIIGFKYLMDLSLLAEVSLRFLLEIKADTQKKSAFIYGTLLNNGSELLYYAELEKLIAHRWQTRMPEPFGSNRVYCEPVDPYGNAEKEYRYSHDGVDESGVFDFNPAGILSRFMLSVEEQ